jgi:hypothetical protein
MSASAVVSLSRAITSRFLYQGAAGVGGVCIYERETVKRWGGGRTHTDLQPYSHTDIEGTCIHIQRTHPEGLIETLPVEEVHHQHVLPAEDGAVIDGVYENEMVMSVRTL